MRSALVRVAPDRQPLLCARVKCFMLVGPVVCVRCVFCSCMFLYLSLCVSCVFMRFVRFMRYSCAVVVLLFLLSLQAECDRLVAADGETCVVVALPSSTDVLSCGLGDDACAHLPSDKDVRIVAVGGGDNWCPCGGTHVKRTSDIRRIVVDKIRVRKNVTKVNYQCE